MADLPNNSARYIPNPLYPDDDEGRAKYLSDELNKIAVFCEEAASTAQDIIVIINDGGAPHKLYGPVHIDVNSNPQLVGKEVLQYNYSTKFWEPVILQDDCYCFVVGDGPAYYETLLPLVGAQWVGGTEVNPPQVLGNNTANPNGDAAYPLNSSNTSSAISGQPSMLMDTHYAFKAGGNSTWENLATGWGGLNDVVGLSFRHEEPNGNTELYDVKFGPGNPGYITLELTSSGDLRVAVSVDNKGATIRSYDYPIADNLNVGEHVVYFKYYLDLATDPSAGTMAWEIYLDFAPPLIGSYTSPSSAKWTDPINGGPTQVQFGGSTGGPLNFQYMFVQGEQALDPVNYLALEEAWYHDQIYQAGSIAPGMGLYYEGIDPATGKDLYTPSNPFPAASDLQTQLAPLSLTDRNSVYWATRDSKTYFTSDGTEPVNLLAGDLWATYE
jgi:hypothetical protein